MNKTFLVGLVIILFLISGCNTGIKTGKLSSPIQIELSIPQANKLNEISELNIKVENKIDKPYENVEIELGLPSTIEYIGDELGINEETNNIIVWKGSLSPNEMKTLKFDIKPVNEGEFQFIVGIVKAEGALDSNGIYLTITENEVNVFSEGDMNKIVAERKNETPLDQLQHRENMTESKGPATI